jgi:hypothetical protein
MRYDEIGISPVRVPSNKQTTVIYAAFAPDAQPEDINGSFDIHLECMSSFQGAHLMGKEATLGPEQRQ